MMGGAFFGFYQRKNVNPVKQPDGICRVAIPRELPECGKDF